MLGSRLQKLRKGSKLTQEEIAAKLGIPRSTYSNYESGKREPDLETTKMLAEFFNVSLDYLTGMYVYPNKEEDKNINELIIKEIVETYQIDLTSPGVREKLESIIKIVQGDLKKDH